MSWREGIAWISGAWLISVALLIGQGELLLWLFHNRYWPFNF